MPAMRGPVKLWFSLILLAGPLPALAFGPTGHRVAGLIADSQLCPRARDWLEPLLDGTTLANAGLWADWIRDDPAWANSRPWHYINVEDTGSLAGAARGSADNLLAALGRFEQELADQRLSREQRAQALRFFVHLLADVHQPLHVGRAGDRGGNDLEVSWRKRERRSLHSLWDAEQLLARERLSEADLARAIGALAADQAVRWRSGGPLDWAEESRAYRPLVYDLPPAGADGVIPLDQAYLATARNIVSLRLAQAGVRLAWRLNRLAGCGP
jgi:hypothetical protein